MDCNRSHVSKNSILSSHLLPGTEPLLGTPVWTTHFPWVTSHERNNQCLHLLSSHSFLNLEEVGSVLVLCSSHSFQERSRFLYCQSSEDTYCPHLTWHIIMKQITKLLPKLLNTSFLKHWYLKQHKLLIFFLHQQPFLSLLCWMTPFFTNSWGWSVLEPMLWIPSPSTLTLCAIPPSPLKHKCTFFPLGWRYVKWDPLSLFPSLFMFEFSL